MKVIKEIENGPTTIEVGPNESFICFDEKGRPKALMSDPKDDEEVNDSAYACAIAMFAACDEEIRALIEQRISDEE